MSTFALALCAPSGTGKTTIAGVLIAKRDDILFSVSATTRSPRPDETEGVDYRFVDRERFESMIRDDELLEWAVVHDQYYGTPRSNLTDAEAQGKFLLLDIDVQGARQVKSARPDSVTIFLLPPSARALLERIEGRGSESEDEVRRRLGTARAELGSVSEFDYIVVNEELEESVRRIDAIVEAECLRQARCRAEAETLRARILRDLEHGKD